MNRLFLLSPANPGGERARILLREEAQFPLARQIRTRAGAPLGEVFTFLSGLYFRGKLAYARRFAAPPQGEQGIWIITSNAGLLAPEEPMTRKRLLAFGDSEIDAQNPEYREPLERDCRRLLRRCGEACEVVLMGSVASGKYVDVLGAVFGERLVFPTDFVGRGDMSRGGLCLRSADSGEELAYAPVLTSVRNGKRPPRLVPRSLRSPRERSPRSPRA